MTDVAKLGVAEELSTVHRSLWGDVWRQFSKHKGALVGVVVFVFIASHFMAVNYVDEPGGFFPPYVEKKIAFPELYEKDGGYDQNKK